MDLSTLGGTTVTVSFTNSGATDTFTLSSANYGTVNTNGNVVSANVSCASSTVVQNGATVTITLGTPSPAGSLNTYATARNMSWTPAASAKDLAGNAMSTTARTEQGALDLDF